MSILYLVSASGNSFVGAGLYRPAEDTNSLFDEHSFVQTLSACVLIVALTRTTILVFFA